MKTTLIFRTFLAFALCGIVGAAAYAMDETLEPEAIPGFNPNHEIEAPAKIVPSVATEDTSLIRPGDVPVKPPKLMRNDTGQLILVQYTSKKPGQTNQPSAQAPSSDLPQQYRDFNSMSEAERRATLRKSIEAVLIANAKRGVNTQNHSPNDVLLMSLPYGADARVYQPNPNANPNDRNAPKGTYIYSIGALCWNTPCDGKTLLRSDGSKIIAKVGYGYQQRPASMAAMLAMSNIMPNYELKVGGSSYTIAHLIESEKASISKGMDMSMALVALSFYDESKAQWKNELGEVWSIEKMVTNELNRSVDLGASDATDWLLGLTAAVKLYESEGTPIRGPLALAKRQIKTYQDFVLSIQNDRYLWHPKFFLYKGFNPDAFETMYSGGHILRWLVYSLPDKELQDPQVTRAVMSLAATVNRVKPETMANSLNAKQLEGLAVSLHALSLYYQRTFGEDPATSQEKSVAVR